jgi:hypothetical protein
MTRGIPTLFFVVFLPMAAQAQTSDEHSTSSSPATTTTQQAMPDANSNQPPLPPVTLKRRVSIPEAPQPKIEDERQTCPGGNGKPCAVLGGRLYFSDSFRLSQHSESWSAAATSPGMLLSLGLLTAATIADLETTQSCIHARTCKEGNPLLGQSRTRAYSVALSVNSVAFWAAAEQKRHGHGVAPFFILWSGTALHSLLAAHNSALATK